MQIKAMDSRRPDILALGRLLDRRDAAAATRKRVEAEIRQIQAGEKAERQAAYQIELYFRSSENWATIHDGPCSRCGRTLHKGTAAVWKRQERRMYCMDCATL